VRRMWSTPGPAIPRGTGRWPPPGETALVSTSLQLAPNGSGWSLAFVLAAEAYRPINDDGCNRRADSQHDLVHAGQLGAILSGLTQPALDHLGPRRLMARLDDVAVLQAIEDARRQLGPLVGGHPEDFIKNSFDPNPAAAHPPGSEPQDVAATHRATAAAAAWSASHKAATCARSVRSAPIEIRRTCWPSSRFGVR
jgi:hypothetical protein